MVLIRIKHIRGLYHWLGQGRVIFLKILILQNDGHVIYQVRNIIRGAIRSYIRLRFRHQEKKFWIWIDYKEYDLFLNRILEMQNEIECDAEKTECLCSVLNSRELFILITIRRCIIYQ